MTALESADATEAPAAPAWPWPLNMARYDRRPELTGRELEALRRLGVSVRRGRGYDRDAPEWQVIGRLLQPLDDARDALWVPASPLHRRAVTDAVGLVLARCAEDATAYWAWSDAEWARLIGASSAEFGRSWASWADGSVRPYVTACACMVGGFTAFGSIGNFDKVPLARRVLGKDAVDEAMQRMADVLGGWGYRIGRAKDQRLSTVLCLALLINRSPRLEDLTTRVFERLRLHPGLARWQTGALSGIQKAVASLGFCDPPPSPAHGTVPAIEGTAQSWVGWVERWYATSALTPKSRGMVRGAMAKAGRWLAAEHPEITEPGQWTRQTCAAWVAAIDRMHVGEYIQRTNVVSKRDGAPVSAQMKAGFLTSSRAFFRDCQEWEWIPRRFDPARALATPASIRALIGPNPRVIADDVWAKLLWAGLNVQAGDLPAIAGSPCYPMELIRAITLTWLFAGQRSDEIARLRVGCIRWQHDGAAVPGDSGDVLARDAVCLLDIPAHKTGTAFTKPVDPLVGKAIEAWQAVRPGQPKMLDRKTGEHVDLLFAVRARRVASTYINATIIPSLCRKAGVPAADARGRITSHRARSTIASQLYNAKEPMTLFELQAWLGHRSPDATRHYAQITPNTLARAYADAGYFARNVRAIEVLIDRDAVTAGAAAAGEPWQYYDLGHGYCTYTFFEQCPHRMACARCDFYTPKHSSRALLLEARDNLQRMLAAVPLTDDERAAVDDGRAALGKLLGQLADTPTPAGPTPRQLGRCGEPPVLQILPGPPALTPAPPPLPDGGRGRT